MVTTPRVNMDDTLNLMYRTLAVGKSRILENNERSIISAYKGDGYMNKITQKKGIAINFVRGLKNEGTSSEPIMTTKSLALNRKNGEGIEIFFNKPGDSMQGIIINLYRSGYNTLVERYASLMDLRRDKDIMAIIEKWVGRQLTR